MQNYKVGDKICLFGFSRGAYTARALAGMLHKVGLLPAYNRPQIPFAWDIYTNISQDGWDMSKEFKKSFCTEVIIDFVGVFDTVSSVGMLGKTLPFTISNYAVRTFRHAMALDERRARFKVAHWGSTIKDDLVESPGYLQRLKWMWKGYGLGIKKHGHRHKHSSISDLTEKRNIMHKKYGHVWEEREREETDVKEVWFAGCHVSFMSFRTRADFFDRVTWGVGACQIRLIIFSQTTPSDG